MGAETEDPVQALSQRLGATASAILVCEKADRDAWWFALDDPPTVLLRGGEEGELLVAQPHGHWPDPTCCVYEPRHLTAVDNLADAEAVAKVFRRRRRTSFRKCIFCGERTAPEFFDRTEQGVVCDGCAERWLGVVH